MSDGPGLLPLILTQLAYQAPFLLVYLVGIAVAAAYLKRCRGPAVLALIALVLMLAVGVGMPVVHGFIIHQSQTGGGSTASTATMFSITAWTAGIVRTVGMGLLIAAVFVGRRPSTQY
jgi:hypothetical protein